jgi:polar amino acid transport system ATP-binding protein
MTMLVVSHEIGLACEATGRMLFSDQGMLVEEGSLEQILSNTQQDREKLVLS